jgi:hypothetical protein
LLGVVFAEAAESGDLSESAAWDVVADDDEAATVAPSSGVAALAVMKTEKTINPPTEAITRLIARSGKCFSDSRLFIEFCSNSRFKPSVAFPLDAEHRGISSQSAILSRDLVLSNIRYGRQTLPSLKRAADILVGLKSPNSRRQTNPKTIRIKQR